MLSSVRKPRRAAPAAPLELTRFFPYKLAVLAERVSLAVAQVYADRYELARRRNGE